MIITGGTFNLNTADDALHSDGNLTITGGTFLISTGDDAIHAEQFLLLGKNGDNNDLIKINITKSYEGLEGAQIYIYSGTYRIIASDDGINAAGDNEEECDNWRNRPGQGNNFGPNGRHLRNINKRNLQPQPQSQCNNFHIYIYGGDIYVNAESDGIDANGNILISGGNIEVWGAKTNTDGDIADADGTVAITGGTFFGGGNAGMTRPDSWSNSQNKINGQNSVNANRVVNIMSGSNIIKSYTSPKNIGYLYYTSPNVDSTYKFSISTSSPTSSPTSSSTSSPTSPSTSDIFDNYKNKGELINYVKILFLLVLSL